MLGEMKRDGQREILAVKSVALDDSLDLLRKKGDYQE